MFVSRTGGGRQEGNRLTQVRLETLWNASSSRSSSNISTVVAVCCSMHVYSDDRHVLPCHHTADTLLHQEATACHEQSACRVQRWFLHHDSGGCRVSHRSSVYADEACWLVAESTSSDILRPTTCWLSRHWENGRDRECNQSTARTYPTTIPALAHPPWREGNGGDSDLQWGMVTRNFF